MVNTKVELKIKVRKWVDDRKEPFKTQDVHQYCKAISSNISISPHRLKNYIRSTKLVVYDSSKKIWKMKKLVDEDADKRQGEIQRIYA